jgi:hypothetical protein
VPRVGVSDRGLERACVIRSNTEGIDTSKFPEKK